MSEFTALINNKDLFQVEVEFRPIVDVLNLINDQIKSLEDRISSLESISKTHVSTEDYESSNKAMIERISPIEERLNSITNSVSVLSTDLKNLDSKTNLTINERVNEILVSTNMNINHSASTINAQVRENYEVIKSIKQEVDDFISDQKNLNIESLKESVKKNSRSINDVKKKLSELSSDFTNSSRNDEDYNGDTNNDATLKINDDIKSLNKEINQAKDDIRSLTSEIKEIKERLSITEENAFLRNDDLISANSSLSSTASPSKNKFDDLNQLNDALKSLKEGFSDHEANVVNAMKAIQFELQQIRDNGQGLLDLPPLNLHNVVPSFFNEDKKILSISDSESAPVLELAEKPSEEEEESEVKKKKRVVDNEAEKRRFMHAQSILKNKNNKTNNRNDNNNNNKTDNSKCVIIQTSEIASAAPVNRQAIDYSKIDIDSIVRRIKNEMNLSDIQKSFIQFKKDHDDIINSIERKVDREYVERLFDKFRVIVHSLNDRIKELATLTDDYATKEELKIIVQLVKNLPKESRPGTALKRGPTCLFCGRPKSSIAGEISPRTAAMVGTAPVSNVGTKEGENGCEFVYGDGQAYRRDENFQSFPHLDVLPPLPVSSTEEVKNNKTSEEANGRVTFVRNSEIIKTSASMPNSRLSKSRK